MCGTANGMPVNSVLGKDFSTENCDLLSQGKDSDTIPSSTSHERKISLSSCSSDGFTSSKERFVLLYILEIMLHLNNFLVSSTSMAKNCSISFYRSILLENQFQPTNACPIWTKDFYLLSRA
jgi:hypothetical protein